MAKAGGTVCGLSQAEPDLDWRAIYEVHAPALRRRLARRMPDRTAVEDAVQETFLRAYRGRASFDERRPIWPWLVAIAWRVCVDAWRTGSVAIEPFDPVGEAEALWGPVDDGSESEVELRVSLAMAFKRLPVRDQRFLRSRERGMSYRAIAASEDVSAEAVKSAIARARRHLRSAYVSS